MLIGIAPPVDRYDFSAVRVSHKPKFFIQGSMDEICPLKRMYEFYSQLPEPKELAVIDGASHLFDGKVDEVGDAIEDLLGDSDAVEAMTCDAVIVSAVRTPVGKAPSGSLRNSRPDDMAARRVWRRRCAAHRAWTPRRSTT